MVDVASSATAGPGGVAGLLVAALAGGGPRDVVVHPVAVLVVRSAHALISGLEWFCANNDAFAIIREEYFRNQTKF